ncbi:hypothetical protein F5X68DRAFT_53995 [Plectosphaerella plurivora]|uniref:Uncharacterized protein n=1 Tax=Plectosphaerella plurivora TaxID=936078 RepID=A0A9P9A6Q5_9PEZI|nr:hypothetical protein F5X68DRAFT_53995 [Plectosphaerella plurivora]
MANHRLSHDALAALIPSAIAGASQGPTPDLRCCCGRDDCAFLKYSNTVLDSVEKDVHTAAKLGQALLARHEAYMADAERDRFELTTRIEQLEFDKRELQAENARTVEENRALLDQLENLNNSVHSSDIRIQTLEATLLSSQQAVRRLEGAAARAAEMERHVALLEREQLALQNTLLTTESEARSALSRWKKAERGISELQSQLERMEKEAKEERERHAETMDRMDRQREMEKELNTAAGRLKGAAAVKTIEKTKGSSAVVSHFVKDLLQDNANLQLGIAELRELLTNSHDEIQALRDQLLFHQPVNDGEVSTTSTLRAELEPPRSTEESPSARLSQEFHIHHHYHVEQKVEVKKARKKRSGLTPGIFSPPAGAAPSTPPNTTPWRLGASPAAPAMLSQPHRGPHALSLGQPSNHRWSVFSEQPSEVAASSVPSSPVSTHRYSMFDRLPDSDLPSSPTTSVDPLSPTLRASHLKRPSEISNRSIFTSMTPSSPVPAVNRSSGHDHPGPIHEESADPYGDADAEDSPDAHAATDESAAEESSFSIEEVMPRPQLRRMASHESIMSLSGGLDIHTLKIRPSQMALRPLGGAEVVFSSVTASSTIASVTNKRSSAVLRDNLAGLPGHRNISSPTRSLSPAGSMYNTPGKLARWSSWRPWGGGSSPSGPDNSPAPAQPATPAPSTTPAQAAKTEKEKEKEREWQRASGINQPGAIPGFQEYLAYHQRRGAPSKVLPDIVDVEALREGLEG